MCWAYISISISMSICTLYTINVLYLQAQLWMFLRQNLFQRTPHSGNYCQRILSGLIYLLCITKLPVNFIRDMDNVLISPHCTDQTVDMHHKAIRRFITDVTHYMDGTRPESHIVDKTRGY